MDRTGGLVNKNSRYRAFWRKVFAPAGSRRRKERWSPQFWARHIDKMTDEREEVIGLTREILNRYFTENDLYFLLSYLDDDVVWIGGAESRRQRDVKRSANGFLITGTTRFPLFLKTSDMNTASCARDTIYARDSASSTAARRTDSFSAHISAARSSTAERPTVR